MHTLPNLKYIDINKRLTCHVFSVPESFYIKVSIILMYK
jgi:hypothetical protein